MDMHVNDLINQLGEYELDDEGVTYAPRVSIELNGDGEPIGLAVGLAATIDDETRVLWMEPDTDVNGGPGVRVHNESAPFAERYSWEDLT